MAATLMRCARGVVVSGAKTWRCRQQLSSLVAAGQNHRCFSATTPSYAGRLLAVSHEWVVMDGKVGTVGISNHAQDTLGDIVFVEFPEVDRDIEKGDVAATVESVKAVAELYSPVSGKIIEINEGLTEAPGIINSSPYDDGWLYKVELSDMSELETLMNEEDYDKFLETVEE